MPKDISRRKFVATSARLAVATQLIPLTPLEAAAQRLPGPERRTLRAAADCIIPADGRMPSASAVGAVAYIERIAGGDAKLRAVLVDALRAIASHSSVPAGTRFDSLPVERQAAVLREVAQTERTAPVFGALRDAVYEAYYTQPKVWRLLGYSVRRSRRRTAPVEAFDEQLVARVRSMPPLFREVPR